ncbi:hypothetical protein [uncultured Brevundimonas sp.]|uniref:hypothetical protein n=1 Tax=uncultured Brevundimonas sp. TaxID=213418 RepID=UPI0030EB6ECA|tara:strand:+ start:3829 stop:4389 length:561 start_codon:yes stop_codon:yes gene_type:complete
MTITYTDHEIPSHPYGGRVVADTAAVVDREPYTPVYARSGKARNGRKAVKTWMILAPVGAVVLIGGAAAMMMGGETTSSLGAPVPVAAPPAALPTPEAVAPLSTEAPVKTVIAAPAPAARPAARTATPFARVRPAAVVSVAPAEPAPVPAGPQPYLSGTATPAATSLPPQSVPVLPPEPITSPPLD